MFSSLLILFKENQTAQLSQTLFISPISGSKQHNGLFISNDSNTVKMSKRKDTKCVPHIKTGTEFSHSVMQSAEEGRTAFCGNLFHTTLSRMLANYFPAIRMYKYIVCALEQSIKKP